MTMSGTIFVRHNGEQREYDAASLVSELQHLYRVERDIKDDCGDVPGSILETRRLIEHVLPRGDHPEREP